MNVLAAESSEMILPVCSAAHAFAVSARATEAVANMMVFFIAGLPPSCVSTTRGNRAGELSPAKRKGKRSASIPRGFRREPLADVIGASLPAAHDVPTNPPIRNAVEHGRIGQTAAAPRDREVAME